MADEIGIYLLSGFLGAGKTTLLRQLLEYFSDRRLGVLVNEFGSIGIDGALVRRDEIQLVEINNGSIFCACLKDGFVRTLKAFSQQPIDLLLIENSGMADPSSMGRLLAGLAPYLERPFAYRGSICLVDCSSFSEYVDVLLPVENQVRSADLILVNKTDLATAETLAEIHDKIAALNSEVPVVDTVYARLPAGILEQSLFSHGYEGESANRPQCRPGVYTLRAEGAVTAAQLTAFHDAIGTLLLRMKGFARTADGWLLVQSAGGQLALTPEAQGPADGKTALVLIEKTDGDHCAILADSWRSACGTEPQIELE